MKTTRTGSAAAAAVSLADALVHLRADADGAANDAYITALIDVATRTAEDRMERTIVATPWRVVAADFGGDSVLLANGPVTAITGVTYVDTDGATQPLVSDQYQIETVNGLDYLVPAPDVTWPAVQSGNASAVTVNYTAGLSANAAGVPKPVWCWILLALTDLYEGRKLSGDKPEVPKHFHDSLLQPYRVMGI